MSVNRTLLSVDKSSLIDFISTREEPEWILAERLQALELVEQLPYPKLEKTRLEQWDFGLLGSHVQPRRVSSLQELPAGAASHVVSENVIVGRNSGVAFIRLSDELEGKGVIFTDLDIAVRDHTDLVRPYYMRAIHANENIITALHATARTGGVFLYVPENVHIEVPLQALFVQDQADAIHMPHVLIVAEANSCVTFIENVISSLGSTGSYSTNGMLEVFVKPGAKVSIVSIHNVEASVIDTTYRRAVVEADGAIEWIIGELNEGNAVSDTTTLIQGTGASSDAKIICVGKGGQKLDLTTRAVHFGKHTDSDMLTKAVMTGQSTAIINGITKIEKGASGTNGQQTERVLMLSPEARGDANPILLIDEDDVKAGHAASVGQVNAEQLYYLMSRGINKEEAQRLIINGFLMPVIAEIPYEDVQDQIIQLVERKLGIKGGA
ncbi:Fe-S cluster assembly protein SufD [Paenibacillus agri]|uniref:Fe-S cluster assembly protein SufD n=1 Tax=Paenibacillus agri TaxID=2744309 RepID=A0A850EL26_9BACL|nr:Fe-S cluster assembly protein SufD [Paenibacillus agri]NUU60074.1 Fe-S cluster assembly protein SufD [Paenibacillus agri]